MTFPSRKKFSILIMASVRWYNASAHYALSLAQCLKKAGIRVVLFGIPQSPVIIKSKELGIDIFDKINLMNKNPVNYLLNINKFRKMIIEKKINIIHPHISRDHTFSYLALMRKNAFIIRTRSDAIPPKNHILNKFFYSYSARHYTVPAQYMKSFLKSMDISDRQISVVPQGINYRDFADYTPCRDIKNELGIPANRAVVSFIGRLDTIKGVEHFIKSYSFLKDKTRYHFIISGEEINISVNSLKKIADQINIKNISFIERVNDVRDLLSITDIGVIPSIGSEAICRIALEMLSFGIPIIGSNINSIPETIAYYNGIVVTPGKPEEIAIALEKLIKGDYFKKIGKDIKLKIKREAPEKFLSEYLNIYSTLLGD